MLNSARLCQMHGGISYATVPVMEFAELMRRRTFAFALAVVQFCRTLPHTAESDVFRGQLLRSGTHGTRSKPRPTVRDRLQPSDT